MYYIIHKDTESIFLSIFKNKISKLIYGKCCGILDANSNGHYFFMIDNYDWKNHISKIEKELIKHNIHYSKTCECDIINLESNPSNIDKLYIFSWGFCCN